MIQDVEVTVLNFIKELFKPEVGSRRWLKNATREDILAYWDFLSKIVRDPNADMKERIRIRDYVIPHLRKILKNK